MSAADPLAPDPAGPCLFRCTGCEFDIECLPADAERYVLVGCPLCGGPVDPVGQPAGAAAVVSEAPPPAAERGARNQRLVPRRLVRGGAKAEVRRGALGLGKDLAVGLADLSEDGLGVRLSTPVRPKEECEVVLLRAGGGKPIKLGGEFRWCTPEAGGTYRVGIRFQRRLARKDLLTFVK